MADSTSSEQIVAALRAALIQASVVLRMFQSAIQCGEDWTPNLDNSYRIMRAQIDAALAAAQAPERPQS